MRDRLGVSLLVLVALCVGGCRVGILGHAEDKWKCSAGQVALYYDRGEHPACVGEGIAALSTCTKALATPPALLSGQIDAATYTQLLQKCIEFAQDCKKN